MKEAMFDGSMPLFRRDARSLTNEYIIFQSDKPASIDAVSLVEDALSQEVLRLLGYHNGVAVYYDPHSADVVSINRNDAGVTFIVGGYDNLNAYKKMMDRFNLRNETA